MFKTVFLGAIAALGLSFSNITAAQDYTWSAGDNFNGWIAYINAFDTDCTTWRGYGYAYTMTDAGGVGDQVAALTADGFMNIYSNYNDGNQPNICLETNVYREVIISAGDAGDYRFNYTAIDPGALIGDNTSAFIKVLTMGYADTGLGASSVTPGTNTVVASISEADLGAGDLRVQFGFMTYAAGYNNSGMFYNDLAFGNGLARPNAIGSGSSSAAEDPTGIPVMPLWGLLGLAGLIGFMGYRRKQA